MSELEIKRVFMNYLNKSFNEDNYKTLVNIIKSEPIARKLIVNQMDNYSFRKVVKEFNLDNSYIEEREGLEKDILNNSRLFDISIVQEALCDILFQNNKQNIILCIRTLQERASLCPEFNSKFSKYQSFYSEIMSFLNLSESTSPFDVEEKLKLISKLNKELFSNKTCCENLKEMFDIAEKDFQEDLRECLADSREKILLQTEPEFIDYNGVKIPIYKMENKTQSQASFQFLGRTMQISILLDGDPMENYINYANQKEYLSYSLMDQSVHSGFAQKTRVKFAYFDCSSSEMWSCNTRDGQTNQYKLKKGKYVLRQEFLPISDFLQQTHSYNEIVFDNPKSILPSAIVVTIEPIDENILRLASLMKLPIIFIDEKCYNPYPICDDDGMFSINEAYSYRDWSKTDLSDVVSVNILK